MVIDQETIRSELVEMNKKFVSYLYGDANSHPLLPLTIKSPKGRMINNHKIEWDKASFRVGYGSSDTAKRSRFKNKASVVPVVNVGGVDYSYVNESFNSYLGLAGFMLLQRHDKPSAPYIEAVCWLDTSASTKLRPRRSETNSSNTMIAILPSFANTPNANEFTAAIGRLKGRRDILRKHTLKLFAECFSKDGVFYGRTRADDTFNAKHRDKYWAYPVGTILSTYDPPHSFYRFDGLGESALSNELSNWTHHPSDNGQASIAPSYIFGTHLSVKGEEAKNNLCALHFKPAESMEIIRIMSWATQLFRELTGVDKVPHVSFTPAERKNEDE